MEIDVVGLGDVGAESDMIHLSAWAMADSSAVLLVSLSAPRKDRTSPGLMHTVSNFWYSCVRFS